MVKRTLTFAAIAASVAIIWASVPAHAFTTLSRINTLRVSGAVALPGVVLAPGTYRFEAGPGNTDFHVVRVLSPDLQRVYFMGLTSPVRRPRTMAPNQALSLDEARPGTPARITAWYPVGSNTGFGFTYR